MKKKSLLKRIFKKRKKKLKIDSKKTPVQEKVKQKINKQKAKTNSWIKKIFASDKFGEIRKFFLMVAGYGFIANFSFHFIFGVSFNVFTVFAWGILYFLVREEFVEWFRRLIAKR